MSFSHPWVLLFLAIPAILIVASPTRIGGIVLPFDHQPHAHRRWIGWVLGVFDRVPALILAAVILMLAGPQMMRQPKETRQLTNIQLAIDVSGSMTGEPYENARAALEEFVKPREGDAFGLTIFGSYQMRWVPLTTDLSAIVNALPFANPANQPGHMGGTRIGAALLFCRDNMVNEAERGDRMIILVSDGMSSDLGARAETDHAQELIDADITLFHIHIGGAIPRDIADIAERTGGQSFATQDAAGMTRVFERIDHMKPARFVPGGTVPMEHFWPFALAALVGLGVHSLGLLGARYTPW